MYYRWYCYLLSSSGKKEGHLQDGYIPDTLLLYLLLTVVTEYLSIYVLSRMISLPFIRRNDILQLLFQEVLLVNLQH